MWEQLLMASFMQRHWADNQVRWWTAVCVCVCDLGILYKILCKILCVRGSDILLCQRWYLFLVERSPSVHPNPAPPSPFQHVRPVAPQVSCTVTFDPETEGPQLPAALAHFQYMLKGVSFLPRPKSGVPTSNNHDYEAEEKLLAAIVQPYAQVSQTTN